MVAARVVAAFPLEMFVALRGKSEGMSSKSSELLAQHQQTVYTATMTCLPQGLCVVTCFAT